MCLQLPPCHGKSMRHLRLVLPLAVGTLAEPFIVHSFQQLADMQGQVSNLTGSSAGWAAASKSTLQHSVVPDASRGLTPTVYASSRCLQLDGLSRECIEEDTKLTFIRRGSATVVGA